MASCDAALKVLCDPKYEVSAHYLISETGEVLALVDEDLRAWHAGAGRWGAVRDVNSRSIGIELANPGDCPFAAPQMDALAALLGAIMAHHGVPPERVIAHSDCAPGRKIDPGARFDWRRLARSGLAIWSDAGPQALNADAFDAALTTLGYDPNKDPETRLAAFRLRHRPAGQGPLDPADMGRAVDLANRFPVDRAGVWA
jgi:N-acetylmuramoyl-L-alanine amidase